MTTLPHAIQQTNVNIINIKLIPQWISSSFLCWSSAPSSAVHVLRFFNLLFFSCYHLCESEIKEFLNHMLKVLEDDGSTAAVTEIMR